MQKLIKKPFYDAKPIGTVKALSRCLGVPETTLNELAEEAPNLYREASRKLKRDGSYRITYDALPSLKSVHDKILKRILRRVAYPSYIQGGIRDPNSPRSPSTNAKIHQGSEIIINIDVSRFYPSISSKFIFNIWRGVFGFSPVVAELLTKLTTLNSVLPEGAKPSSYLANLAFWRTESSLVVQLADEGIQYTRYIDDISISSRRRIGKSKIEAIIRLIHKMLNQHGLRINRKKLKILGKGGRMVINNLTVNDKPSLPPEKRSQIRLIVHNLIERGAEIDPHMQLKSLRSACGKVNYLAQFHPAEGAKLKSLLDQFRIDNGL